MKKRKPYIIQIGCILAFMLLAVIGIMCDSSRGLQRMLSDSIHQTLNETAGQQTFNLHQKMEADISALNNIALQLEKTLQKEIDSYLDQVVQNTGFSVLALVGTDGIGTDNKGNKLEVFDDALFQQVMKGETVVGDVADSLFTDKTVIPVMVPVISEGVGTPIAVLIGGYTPQRLNNLLLPSFDGKGVTYMISRSGSVVLPTDRTGNSREVPFENVRNYMKVINGSSQERVMSDMQQGKSGHMVFDIDGIRWHCHYNPVKYGGWYIFTLLRHDIGAAYATKITSRLTAASGLVLICFLVCGLLILRQQRRYMAILEKVAYYDELCKCPNLSKFKLDVQKFMDDHPEEMVLMTKFDIRGFKLLNKILGEEVGNTVLITIASTLEQEIKIRCYCRAHDDEFYVFLCCPTPEELDIVRSNVWNQFYERMGTGFSYPIEVIEGRYFMSFNNCRNAVEAVEKTNIAHGKAKELGEKVCTYDEELVKQALWKQQVEHHLETSLKNSEFKIYLQAQNSLDDETLASAEALVRWEKEGNLIPPNNFIPILEQKGLITKLDFYVFEQVCRMMQKWENEGRTPIEIAVNFSRRHLENLDFIQDLCSMADQYGIPHHLLVVELTETAMWDNEKIIIQMVEQLHKNGFLMAMDDFGTGYSSLSLLKNLPVDIMKIDRSFFYDNQYSDRAGILISNVMNMAKQLGMVTVAEGIEEQRHIDFLRQVGCDKVQGYYFARPVPAESFWAEDKEM